MGEALVSEHGALKHMGSAMGDRRFWRESHRLTLACYPKSEVDTARMRDSHETGKGVGQTQRDMGKRHTHTCHLVPTLK